IEGIWHTSVEVFGREYYFQSGVIHSEPGKTHHGEALEKIKMGVTSLTAEMFKDFLYEMEHKYNDTSYDLFKNNCNHFSNDVTLFLVGKTIKMGVTSLTAEMFKDFLYEMEHKYNDTSYDLFKNNCNHFSNDVTLFLVGKTIPDHILLLPEIFMESPLYKMFIGMNSDKKEDEGQQ
ncbi:hypothetical protein H312_00126, partial [Anncaliia algerae PRA339]